MFHIEHALVQAGYVTRSPAGEAAPGRLWYPRDRDVPAPVGGAVIRVSRENEIELVEFVPSSRDPIEASVTASTLVFPSVDCLQGWLRRFSRASDRDSLGRAA